MTYSAPVRNMLFAIKELADIDAIARLPGFEEAGFETAQAVPAAHRPVVITTRRTYCFLGSSAGLT